MKDSVEVYLTCCMQSCSCNSEKTGERIVSKYFIMKEYGIIDRTFPTVHIIRTFSLAFNTFPLTASCQDKSNKTKLILQI